MKKLYIIVLAFVLGVASCQTDEIDLYEPGDGSYVSFVNAEVDTIEFSFLVHNVDEYQHPVVLRHSGIFSQEGKAYSITVVDSMTTMKSGYYQIPENLKFQPMSEFDTTFIFIKNYAELADKAAFLCIELKGSDQLMVGDRDYRRVILKISNDVLKPSWWDSNVTNYLLGTYSKKKFKLLLEVVNPDLSNITMTAVQNWTLQLKRYLELNPVMDEDGEPMTVEYDG